MNLFDLQTATDEQMSALGWDGAAAMLKEGAEMATNAVNASLDELQNYLVELNRDGVLPDAVLFRLASLEQACFSSIHQMGTLESQAQVTAMMARMLAKYKAEQEQGAAENA